MQSIKNTRLVTVALSVLILSTSAISENKPNSSNNNGLKNQKQGWDWWSHQPVQLGPRPFYLVEELEEGHLKSVLQQCGKIPFFKTDFSISHRGAAMQFPEHTKESYRAAARMGAGIVECDVTFTKDRELVCRHSQCDLQSTTDILARPELAAKCSEPFTPADPQAGTEASAKC